MEYKFIKNLDIIIIIIIYTCNIVFKNLTETKKNCKIYNNESE